MYDCVYYKVGESSDNGDSDMEEDDHGDNYDRVLAKYVKYFEKTWLGAINPRTEVRGRPVFKMSLWLFIIHYNTVYIILQYSTLHYNGLEYSIWNITVHYILLK